MWRRATRGAAGALLVIAIAVLVMIGRAPDDGPPTGLLVPPPGEVSQYVPPTSVVDIVAAQPAESTTAPAQTSSPQQTITSPKPVTHQPANPRTTTTTRATAPVPGTSAAKPPAPAPGPAIVCPGVAGALPAVPPGAQSDVTRELRYLDAILADANQRLLAAQNIPDPRFVQNAIVGPLVNQRIASLDRIAIAIGRFAPRPSGLERLAHCTVR